MTISLIRKKKLKKFNFDKLREECGIFGISNHEDASALVALGLHALQHRGQEGCGIVSFDGKNFHSALKKQNPRGAAAGVFISAILRAPY